MRFIFAATISAFATLHPCNDVEAQGRTTTTAQPRAVSSGTAAVFTAAPRAATQELEVISGRAAISINPSLWKEQNRPRETNGYFSISVVTLTPWSLQNGSLPLSTSCGNER